MKTSAKYFGLAAGP